MNITSLIQGTLSLLIACFVPSSTLFAGSHGKSAEAEMPKDNVKIVSATTIIGYDVFDTNGEKVGDIANFVLDLQEFPRLTHVIVITGGFLDLGGTKRAVPAKAISWNGERYILSVDKSTFTDAPVLPDNLERFFNRKSHLEKAAEIFKVEPVSIEGNVLFFSQLDFHDIESVESGILGYLTDVYLSVDHGLTPYLIMAPTDPLLDSNTLTRYAIPTTAFVRAEDPDLVFDITIEDLIDTQMTESTESISAEQAGRGLAYKLNLSQ